MRTKSARGTKRIASKLAQEIRSEKPKKHAFVILLHGNLGAGKTTFAQGFAGALGIKERILSPTFVLMKIYPIRKKSAYKFLVHIDCYRIDSTKDVVRLGVKDIFLDKDAIVLVEWPERIRQIIPKRALLIRFGHGRKEQERVIRIAN